MITPLEDNVIIKMDAPQEKTKHGICLPESARESTSRGVVIACGNGKTLTDGKIGPMNVKVNDRVILNKYSATESNSIIIDDEEYHIVSQGYILAKE